MSKLKPLATPHHPPRQVIGQVLHQLQTMVASPDDDKFHWALISANDATDMIAANHGTYSPKGKHMLMTALRQLADNLEAQLNGEIKTSPTPGIINPN